MLHHPRDLLLQAQLLREEEGVVEVSLEEEEDLKKTPLALTLELAPSHAAAASV